MKTTIALCSLLFSFIALSAQQIRVTQKTVAFQNGQGNAYSGSAFQLNAKAAEKFTKEFFKKAGGKTSDKKNELTILGAKIEELGTAPVDVWVQFNEVNDDEVNLNVAYKVANDFLSGNAPAETLTYNLLLTLTKLATTEKLNDANKELEKAEKEAKDLADKKTDLEKTIAECEKKIADSRKAIDENKANAEKQLKVIEGKKLKVNSITTQLNGLK